MRVRTLGQENGRNGWEGSVWPLTWAPWRCTKSLVPGTITRYAQTPVNSANTVCLRRPARRRHTSELPERARRSGLSGRCLAAQTRRAWGPARARGRLGRGGGARSPPATRAALRPARGVCTGPGPEGPMFTELRTKLSPPRGRAGAVRAGFGERRDADGEQGWTWAQGYRGSHAPRGTGARPAGLGAAAWRGGGRVRGLCPALGVGGRPQALGTSAPLVWGK